MAKQTLTEKFLWAIFNLSETAGDIWELSTNRRRLSIFTHYHDYYSVLKAWEKEGDRQKFTKFISYLKERGYIREKFVKNKRAILLTQKGLDKVFQINLKQTNHKERPDKKWQMVIFDVPEKFHTTRDRFRAGLKILGYKQLQQSVWISPYDISKETERLVKFYRTESWIKHFLIEKVDTE